MHKELDQLLFCQQFNRLTEFIALLLNKRYEEITKTYNDFLTANIR